MSLAELTLNDAKLLKPGDILYSTVHKNRDGTPQRWRVAGTPKTWKRDPNRVRVPLKFGLSSYDYIDESNFRDGVCEFLAIEVPD